MIMGKSRRLVETLESQFALASEPVDLFPRMVAEWATRVQYPELSALAVCLRSLGILHQTHHWQAKGDPFYGDHLLFERLYGTTTDEVDSISERAVGLGGLQNVDMHLVVKQLAELATVMFPLDAHIPTSNSFVGRSHRAELSFLKAVSQAVDAMKANGTLTRGLDNLLAGIEDTHEGNVYLLKQRMTA